MTPAEALAGQPHTSGMIPETRYAKSGDVHIAYQVVGQGPIDVVLIPGLFTHVEHQWEEPSFARFLSRLASFSRLIVFDARGAGLSDQAPELPPMEEQMDDVLAVMDAAGSKRAAIAGTLEGGPMAALFAATHPDRVSHLVLYATFARVSNSGTATQALNGAVTAAGQSSSGLDIGLRHTF